MEIVENEHQRLTARQFPEEREQSSFQAFL
jgi:hypothetical protein